MKTKKAELTTKEIIELILGAAAIFVLVMLVTSILNSQWDKDEEIAKGYLDMLNSELEIAEQGGTGLFSIYESHEDFVFVYFGSRTAVYVTGKNYFKQDDIMKHSACMCIEKEEGPKEAGGRTFWYCEYCDSLDYPISQDSLKDGYLDIWFTHKYEISFDKDKEEYNFKWKK